MKTDWIALLDCNNFFVSCERLFRPDLNGKPVIVLSSNDGCVVARSQEVKDMGISMGVPYFKIKDIIKDKGITTFSSHLALYRDVSRRVFEVMREELDIVEQYSIDEAFFQILDDPVLVAKRVKNRVEKVVGIPVSIGISRTKTLAKFANTYAKKGGGVHLLEEGEAWSRIAEFTPLSTIWGVGGKLEMQYKKHGLITVQQLLNSDRERVARLFGIGGVRLRDELSGNRVFALGAKTEQQKSVLSSRSFKDETTSLTVLSDSVAYHVRHAVADLRSMKLEAKGIRVGIQPSRYGDFVLRGVSKEAIFNQATSNTLEIMKIAETLLKDIYETGVPYKKAGITLFNFTPAGSGQGSLFAAEKPNTDILMSIIDGLNNGKAKEVVLFGSRLKTSQWQSKSEERSPAYTTRWKDIAKVSAKS